MGQKKGGEWGDLGAKGKCHVMFLPATKNGGVTGENSNIKASGMA